MKYTIDYDDSSFYIVSSWYIISSKSFNFNLFILINMIGCAPLCAPMGHMGHMLYCAPLFINGDIDTEVVDTDA